jgi:flavorubredoxin
VIKTAIDTSELNPLTSKVNKQESITTTDTNQVRRLYVEGNGKIDELSINSDKDTLKLRIVIDDVEVYNEVLSWYDTNDAILYNIDTSGALLVSIRDIYFKESFTIEYTPAETTYISLIMCRYSV